MQSASWIKEKYFKSLKKEIQKQGIFKWLF